MPVAKLKRGRVRNEGMGGFLNPPTHPEHTHCVEFDLIRRPENRGSMSLESAVTSAWLDAGTRAAARRLLRDWKRPALESAEVQEWVLQVLSYFRGCYRSDAPEPECWHAGNLRIIRGSHDPLPPVEEHAGVHLIRKYYPEFVPTDQHFAGAYWGRKPEVRP